MVYQVGMYGSLVRPTLARTRNELGRCGLPNRADFENAGAETRQRHLCTTGHPSIHPSIHPACETARQPTPAPTGFDIRIWGERKRGKRKERVLGHLRDQMQPVVSPRPTYLVMFGGFFFLSLYFSADERGPASRSPLTVPQASFATWQ